MSSVTDCKGCADRAKCISECGSVRWVYRLENEESRQRNIALCHTDEGRAILMSRKYIVEPPFGHMKTYGGLGLITSRGNDKANLKVVMGAAAYDLIKLVKALQRITSPANAHIAAINATGRTLSQIESGLRSLLANFLSEGRLRVSFLNLPVFAR